MTQTLQFETESNMLARNDEVEAEVRAEDQQKINEFGRLNTQKGEYQLDVAIANKAMSQLEAAEEEIMLSDVSFQPVLYPNKNLAASSPSAFFVLLFNAACWNH